MPEEQAPEFQATPGRGVFISYASHDKAMADTVCKALESAGIVCWIAPRDVTPGEFYADAIVGAINASRVLVVVLTQSAVVSPHVLREVERASAKRHPVVSLRIDAALLPAGLEYFLSASHWLDATKEGVSAAMPKLVEAVRRLIAPQPSVDSNRASDSAEPAVNLFPQPPVTQFNMRLSRPLLATAAVITLLVGYLVMIKPLLSKHVTSERSPATATPAAAITAPVISEKSIAVLPFVDMSEKHDHEYFADGVSEELLNVLTKVPELRVISRSSVFSFKGKNVQIQEIAKRLGVSHILEGSVRLSGNRVRITTQLIDARTDTNLWSETYDRTLDDIFAVQVEIAQSVAGALKVALLDEPKKTADAPSNQNIDAYTAYLQGRYYQRRYSAADLRKAIGFYNAAIRNDPHYALAYSALSTSLWALGDITGKNVAEVNRKARATAERAVAEDPNLAEGHAALGQILVSVDRNAKGAEVEFRRAAELAPASAGPKIGLSSVIADFGQIEEAVALLQQAVRLDPLGADAYYDLARLLTSLGRYDEAVQAARKAIELQPGGAGTWQMLAMVEAKRGNGEAALKAAVQESDPDWRAYAMALAQQALGDRRAADTALAELVAGHSDDMPFQIAAVYAFRGDADKAFEWLNRAYEENDPGVMAVIDNPFTRELRSDPRFKAFLRKIKLPG